MARTVLYRQQKGEFVERFQQEEDQGLLDLQSVSAYENKILGGLHLY